MTASTDRDDDGSGRSRAEGMHERRQHILGLLAEHGRVEVAGLATELLVTEETIRRDLRALEQLGSLTRAHGGAVPPVSIAVPYLEPAGALEGTEPGVVEQVIQLLPERGAVFLDGAGVAEHIASRLPAGSQIDLVTPSIGIAMRASEHPNVQVYMTGGAVDPETGAEEGDWARQTLSRLRLDLAIIVVDGVSRDGELLAQPGVASVRETALARTKRSVLVLCSGEEPAGFAIYGTIGKFDVVVTDAATADARRPALKQVAELREVENT